MINTVCQLQLHQSSFLYDIIYLTECWTHVHLKHDQRQYRWSQVCRYITKQWNISVSTLALDTTGQVCSQQFILWQNCVKSFCRLTQQALGCHGHTVHTLAENSFSHHLVWNVWVYTGNLHHTWILRERDLTECTLSPIWIIVQELCESRGGHPGLSVLTSLLVSMDVKNYWSVLRHWSQLVPNMSADIWGH